MWLDEADSFAEIFKGYLPFYLLVAVPLLLIVAPAYPVSASHEFPVYRMQQYDLHNVPHGCRSTSFNLEGRSLTSWSTSRHCVVARIQDITIDQFMEIRNKAGALLLVLPRNDTMLSAEETEHIQLLEMAMSQQEVNAPVYFAQWSPEAEEILRELQHSFITDEKSGTALQAMLNSVSSNGYQIMVTAPAPQKVESKPVTLHGKLAGRAGTSQTIIISAHYDSSGIVPDLSVGADSNASGAVAVLELARIFSRLYGMSGARGAATLVFVLPSTGHALNYAATKKWLEEHLDSSEDTTLQDVSFAMCLDSLSSAEGVTMHVSKPPRAGGAAHSLQARLAAPINHKKINLADEALAWEHERFSIRRMSAFTLSSLQSHKAGGRSSLLDAASPARAQHLVANIRLIARALASHVYNLTAEGAAEDAALYNDALNVEEDAVRFWYEYLSSQPRAPHITTTGPANAGVTGALERALSRYTEVSVSAPALDKREPEYTLYSPSAATLNVYSVKPAVFDLILSLGIAAYLGLIYLLMTAFPRFYEEYSKLVVGKTKVQ